MPFRHSLSDMVRAVQAAVAATALRLPNTAAAFVGCRVLTQEETLYLF